MEYQLKYFAKNSKKVVLYAGCKMATLHELYLSNAFILNGENVGFKAEHHFLGDGEILTRVCNIERSQKQNQKEAPDF